MCNGVHEGLEDVIRGNSKLTSGNIQWGGATTSGDHEAGRSDGLGLALGVRELHGVRSGEFAQLVEISHTSLAQLYTVAEVKTLDVVLNVLAQSGPVVLAGIQVGPTVALGVLGGVTQNCCVVHHFLRNATYVDAGATETPLRSCVLVKTIEDKLGAKTSNLMDQSLTSRRRLDIIKHSYFSAKLLCFLGTCETS